MRKFNVLFIGVITIGIFMLPAVISTFTGSHDYIAPENVECQTCHPDVYDELLNSQDDHTHANAAWNHKQILDCQECHIVSDFGGSPGSGHAARRVDCAICHNKTLYELGGDEYMLLGHNMGSGEDKENLYYEYGMDCSDCHFESGHHGQDPVDIGTVYETITNVSAAHNTFYENAINDTELLGGTESCVACHSHVDFTITAPLGKNMTYTPSSGSFDRQ